MPTPEVSDALANKYRVVVNVCLGGSFHTTGVTFEPYQLLKRRGHESNMKWQGSLVPICVTDLTCGVWMKCTCRGVGAK